jgi:YkoY family integral membrane protein
MLPSGSNLLTVGLLVALEAMLSADNALVMAVVVLGLPRHLQKKALRQGLAGAFTSRIVATLLAVKLIGILWVKLLGGVYLLYLAGAHFLGRADSGRAHATRPARPMFGLSSFWATVVRVEAINLMFSIDSILVAVAVSRVTWVVITGGIIGLVAMRVIAAQLLRLVERYPPLVDGAFIIIAWIGIQLSIEYLDSTGYIQLEIPKAVSLGLILVIFAGAYVYARIKGPVEGALETTQEQATALLASERPAAESGVRNCKG